MDEARDRADESRGEEPVSDTVTVRSLIGDPGVYALAFGLLGLLLYPALIGEPFWRTALVLCDLGAVILGLWAVWRWRRGRGHADLAVGAFLAAGVGFYLYVARTTGVVPLPGGS
ncbi:MAG: hypothetical protein R2826_06570 [Thermoleophilia bacterium]